MLILELELAKPQRSIEISGANLMGEISKHASICDESSACSVVAGFGAVSGELFEEEL
jgi:hypothetical protein